MTRDYASSGVVQRRPKAGHPCCDARKSLSPPFHRGGSWLGRRGLPELGQSWGLLGSQWNWKSFAFSHFAVSLQPIIVPVTGRMAGRGLLHGHGRLDVLRDRADSVQQRSSWKEAKHTACCYKTCHHGRGRSSGLQTALKARQAQHHTGPCCQKHVSHPGRLLDSRKKAACERGSSLQRKAHASWAPWCSH